jgi:hypothetical protein
VYQGTNGLTIVRNPFAPTNTNQGKASSQGSPADSALTVDAFLDQVNTIIQQQAP